jgi:intein/homing endonuclease
MIGDGLVINKSDDYNENIKINKTVEIKEYCGRIYDDFTNDLKHIPDYVDKDFAKMFGFLLGDGGINFKRPYMVYFAYGIEETVNKKYISLLEKYSNKNIYLRKNNQYANGIASAIVNSKSLATVLSNMGFDGNSRTKRIPKWVYSTSKEIRKAFLDGLMDADGSVNIDKWNCKRFQIELANYELVNDIKLLAQSLGYKTGNINKRKPRKKDVIINGNKVITIADSYVIYFYESENIQTIIADINNRKSDDFIVEKIISIKPDGKGFVFDIHVDNENHNFFANNIIVHNSILNKIRRVFRQCLDSNSKIWTPDGYTKIKDLNINDNVFSYSLKDGKYFTSKVSNISNNGIKERFEIKTRHRNIIVTNDHPILIINENNEYSYKNINEIDKKIDKLVLPSIDENNVTHSIEFLKIIESFDFKTGFSNKIIPDWVFSLPKKWKLEFIRGIFDADGCDSNGNYSSSNKGLIERLRVLSQSCNLKVGNVITHKRKGCEWSDSFNKVIDRKETYTLYIKYENETPNVDFQKITSIESIGMGEVWDIEIDNDEHNFIAEGVVVHNCVMAEDAMLTYRILRAGEKRVFKIDVGNIDEDDVESYIHKIATRFKKQQQIYPDSGQIDYTFNILGNDEDFFLPVRNANVQTGIETLQGACFALDTKIELLDGRSLELKDIINEYNDGKSLWSYSIDPKSGLIVPGKITWAGVTRKNAQVLKLTLDNGETITCTPDHKFPTKYNGKKEAKDLNIGESMWAFNKKEEKISNKKYAKPYEMIYDHSKQDWVFTHRMVANYMKEKNLHEEFTHKYVGKKGINKYWNNISEEELIIKKNIAINNSLMSRDKAVETFSNNPNRDSIIKERGKSISKTKSLKENRIKQAKHIKLRWENSNLREIIKEKQSIKYSHKLLDLLIDYVNEYNRIDLILENKINIKNSEWIEEFNVLNQNNKQLNKMSAITRNNIDKMLKYFGYLNWRDFKSKIPCYNHKIVAIEWLEDKQDTGTITIDGKEQLTDYHTFALSSGIFTLNSNLDQIHDIEYLRDNLFTGLGVPKPFLGYQQAAGDGKNMAQMDVRFAKKINRIQQATIQELNKIAIIHLMLLGFKKEEIYDFQLSLTNPSTQQDLLKTELWQQKAQVYTELTRSESGIAAMSHTNAKKFFFGWSDKDIVDDYLNQRMERAVAQELQDSPLIIRKTGLFSDIDKKYGIGDVPPEELPQAGGGQDGGGLGTEGGPEDLSGMGGGDFGSPAQLPPVESKYIYDKEGQKRLVDSVIRDSNGKKYLSERQYVDLLDRLVKNGKSATEIKETTKNIVINEELNERNQEYIKKASNLVGEIDNLLGEGKDTLNSKSIEHLRTYSEKNEENITEEFNINDIDVDSV